MTLDIEEAARRTAVVSAVCGRFITVMIENSAGGVLRQAENEAGPRHAARRSFQATRQAANFQGLRPEMDVAFA